MYDSSRDIDRSLTRGHRRSRPHEGQDRGDHPGKGSGAIKKHLLRWLHVTGGLRAYVDWSDDALLDATMGVHWTAELAPPHPPRTWRRPRRACGVLWTLIDGADSVDPAHRRQIEALVMLSPPDTARLRSRGGPPSSGQ